MDRGELGETGGTHIPPGIVQILGIDLLDPIVTGSGER